MSTPAECPLCHQPTRSAAARSRGGIGDRCWRKLAPAQRAAIRRDPARIRAVLTTPVPLSDNQLALTEEEIST
ncbi:hypothetical protein [Streptomyces justiciae]|uniref:Uncharacterized protein n=1 Tax=Streptomyces justiciae TaxID=2780140 RepID=A0ABU3M6W0_9ACTN|nr:hypothetical protein [Streptomyces justiciae]MDT7847239.1 hypothetical protein [Streptomyces justiciae]